LWDVTAGSSVTSGAADHCAGGISHCTYNAAGAYGGL
jgi:hypothetical protein